MKTFDEIYETKTVENYKGICDRCGAPIEINEKFWAVLIGNDEDWDYLMLVNFIVYCFSCKTKGLVLRLNNHPFDISNELAALKVQHNESL